MRWASGEAASIGGRYHSQPCGSRSGSSASVTPPRACGSRPRRRRWGTRQRYHHSNDSREHRPGEHSGSGVTRSAQAGEVEEQRPLFVDPVAVDDAAPVVSATRAPCRSLRPTQAVLRMVVSPRQQPIEEAEGATGSRRDTDSGCYDAALGRWPVDERQM